MSLVSHCFRVDGVFEVVPVSLPSIVALKSILSVFCFFELGRGQVVCSKEAQTDPHVAMKPAVKRRLRRRRPPAMMRTSPRESPLRLASHR